MQRLIGGIALGGLGLFMLSGYFNADVARSSPASLAALLLVAGLPLVGSVLLIRGHFRDKHRLQSRKDLLRQQTIESEILKLAMAKGGKLTGESVARIAAEKAERQGAEGPRPVGDPRPPSVRKATARRRAA